MNDFVNKHHNYRLQSPLLEVCVAKPFPIWLQNQLDDRNWKQVDLVRATEGRLRAQTISKWMAGKGLPPELPSIELVAHALSLSVEDVVRAVREEDEPPSSANGMPKPIRNFWLKTRDGVSEEQIERALDVAWYMIEQEKERRRRLGIPLDDSEE
jgi:hypothetical protein